MSQALSVVVIGKGGMLSTAMANLAEERGYRLRAYGLDEVDLAKPETWQLQLEGADVVFNCAAYTAVDPAEQDEALATKINGDAVGELARRCKEAGVALVHYSTDYVFDGHGTAPYPVDAPRAPLNAYGRSKLVGEEQLEASGCEYLLVRTSWVYSAFGNNFVKTMAKLTGERPSLQVVHDQRGRPTHAVQLAARSCDLFQGGARGAFHVTDSGECSWFEFAQEIAAALGNSCEVSPCSTDEFPRPASRPPYSVLDISAAEGRLGAAPSWQESVREVLGQLKS